MELARKPNYVKHYVFKHHLYPMSTKWCGKEWTIHIQTHVQGKSGKRHSTITYTNAGWRCSLVIKNKCPYGYGLFHYRTLRRGKYKKKLYKCNKFAAKVGLCLVPKSGSYAGQPNGLKIHEMVVFNGKLYMPYYKVKLVHSKSVFMKWIVKAP